MLAEPVPAGFEVIRPHRIQSNQKVLKQLSEGLLRSAGRTGVSGNLLEIHHPSAPLFDPVFLHTACEAFGVNLSMAQNEPATSGQRVCCASAQLPFQDQVFSMVVLHHVIDTGHEPELAEACRVTARDGVLILLGLNRNGWRFRTQSAYRSLPGLSPWKVKNQLEALGMTMRGFAGAGLCGREKPVFMNAGLSSLGAPVADVVILQASHADSPGVTPLRFRKPQTGVVQSAPMRG